MNAAPAAAALLLAGCCTGPKDRLILMSRAPVVQTVTKFAPARIDSDLLRPCAKPEPAENSAGAYAEAMRARGRALDDCNERLAKARAALK